MLRDVRLLLVISFSGRQASHEEKREAYRQKEKVTGKKINKVTTQGHCCLRVHREHIGNKANLSRIESGPTSPSLRFLLNPKWLLLFSKHQVYIGLHLDLKTKFAMRLEGWTCSHMDQLIRFLKIQITMV